MRRAGLDHDGFTLLECIIACALLSVGVLSLLQLLVVTAKARDIARGRALTAVLAAQKLEELRSTDATAMRNGGDRLDGNGASATETSQPLVYSRTWTVTPSGSDGPLAIVVRVSGPLPEHEVVLTTLRSRVMW